ncbi:MAG: DUF4214 domain-containing protein [Glaciimonas sp.]|nr:DUF4214 domain-containing protein [Glaciimonas sp.]
MANSVTQLQQDQITQLYVSLFNRAPDAGGFSYWVQSYASGQSLANIAQSFYLSPEGQATYSGALTNTQFINAFYVNFLGRANPDAGGVAYWVGRLGQTGATQGAIAAEIISNVANYVGTDPVVLSSQAIINAKVTVGEYYALTANGNNIATAKSIVAGVVDATTAAAAIAGQTATNGQIYTLTTGVDTLVGAAGNDTFNGVLNAGLTVGTVTPFDSIDGGTGVNTLNILDTSGVGTMPALTVKNIQTLNISSTAGEIVNTATGYAGLTALNINASAGVDTVTAAGTTAVSVNDVQGASAIAVDGGSTVTVTATGVTLVAGTVIVGGTTAPTGAVNITTTGAIVNNGDVQGAITVTGGSTVTIVENITPATATAATAAAAAAGAGGGVTINGGAVVVNGKATTTSVSVTQTNAVAAANATAAVANTSNKVAAVIGIADGNVAITDVNAGSLTTAATIATVSLGGYGTSTISSNALATLNLSGTGGTLGLTEGLTTPTNTTLALNVNGLTAAAISDSSNQFKTINVTTGATKSVIAQVNDTAATALNISGASNVTFTSLTGLTNLKTVAVSGAAGFSGDVSARGAALALTTTSSGVITATLDATTQSFVGSTGQDVITISADATKTITGGTATNNELVLNAAGTTFTAANTVKNVTGFTTLGTTAAVTGIVDMSVLTGFNAIHVAGTNATTSFTGVKAGTSLALDLATTGAIVYQTADTAGVNDIVTVNLGTAATKIGFTTNALTLQDANAIGVGTVNVVSNASVGGAVHIISTLTDSFLGTLNVTGTAGLTVTTLADSATTLAINSNETGTIGTTITGLTDNSLGSLTFGGLNATTITTLTDSAANITIANTSTAATALVTIGGFTTATLSNLTLTGDIAVTLIDSITTGVTINGATDNKVVSANLSGAGIHNVTLGNGANIVVSGSGADVITLGTGANTVTGGAGADKVTFGAHSGIDSIKLAATANAGAALGGDTGAFGTSPVANSISTTAFDVITGMAKGDTIQLAAASYTAAAGAGSGGLIANGTAAITLLGLTLVDNGVEVVRGTYVGGTTNTFVGAATGTDSMVVYDSNATLGGGAIGHEAIVLIGYVAGSVTGIGGASGLITLA